MKKSYSRIIVALVTALTLIICLSGCGKTESKKIDYDTSLINLGKEAIEEFGPIYVRTYDVTFDGGIYTANINGTIQQVQIVDNEPEHITYKTLARVTDRKILSIVEGAKKLIVSYINNSEILVDKEQLIESINNVKVMFTDANLVAEYKNGTVFINAKNAKDVCEWMVTHELVHYLCELTNGSVENEMFPYSLFTEVMTDLITLSMNPKINKDIVSGYSDYYFMVLPYIGVVEKDALGAYFYGYDWMSDKVDRNEFDLYVLSMDRVEVSEVAMVIVSNSVNKWIVMNG